VTRSRIFSATSNILTQQGNKGTAKQPAERNRNRNFVVDLVFPEPAILDGQVVFFRSSFDVK